MNEAQLILELRKWVGVTDPTVFDDSTVQSWIRMGENYLSRKLRIDHQITIDTEFAISSDAVPVPDDWIDTDFVFSNDRSVEFKYLSLREFRTDKPKNKYTSSGRSLFFGGTIEDGETVELHYFARLPVLGATSNWVTENFLDLLTNASLIFGYRRVRETERVMDVENQVTQEVTVMNLTYNSRTPTSGSLRRRVGSIG